jgi:CRISPR-associated protein Cas2
MTVIVFTACPEGLRGHLTRWLMEISAGVFVGHVTSRVRSLLWARIIELSGNGRALMVYGVQGEQRLSFKVHEHHWQPTDYDGVALMLRPNQAAPDAQGRAGWSAAGRRKRFGQQKQTKPDQTPSPEPTT